MEYLTCKACGQVVMCDLPKADMSAEEKENFITSKCNCPAGQKMRMLMAQVDEAKFNIEQLCGDGAEMNQMQPISGKGVFEILNKAVELIASDEIFDLTVKVSSGGTVKISSGTKNQIKVKRTVGFSEQLEANQKL